MFVNVSDAKMGNNFHFAKFSHGNYLQSSNNPATNAGKPADGKP